jgi:hypothetical protein
MLRIWKLKGYTVERKKPSARKKAKAYADKWCRAWAKMTYKECVTCGSKENLQWAHLLTSAAESTRWHEFNFSVQCSSCNLRHEYDSSPFTLWFLKKYGQVVYEDIARIHHTPAHFKIADLIEIGDWYKQWVEEARDE